MRRLLKGLLVTVEPMNLGDVADHVIEDAEQKEALKHLERLGRLTVLTQSDGNTIRIELFSKLRLAYLAQSVDAALRSHDRS